MTHRTKLLSLLILTGCLAIPTPATAATSGAGEYGYLVQGGVIKLAAARGKDKKLSGEAAKLFDLPAELFTSGQEYTKDPLDLLRYRAKVAEMIEKLMR